MLVTAPHQAFLPQYHSNILAGTSEVGIYSYLHLGKKRVYLIDTPGFDDTFRSDTEVLKEIAFSLASLYKQGVKLAGLLYLHRITDRKMQGSALKSLHMLKAVCGESSFPNVVLVSTMWNVLEQSGVSFDSGVQREKELRSNDNFWGLMEKGGSHIVRHSGGLQSAISIVSLLVDKKSPIVLDIQRQMIDEGKSLDETIAGKFVQKELLDARKRHERDIADYQQSMDDALKEKDENMAAILHKQKEEHEAKVSEIIASESGLKVNLSKLAEEKDSQYNAQQLHWEKTSTAEIACYEDNLRKLQDEVDRKDVEYRREMTLLRKEAQIKSAEEAKRLEMLIMAKEKQWVAQQLEYQEQIRLERAMRQDKELELREANKQAESYRHMNFFQYIISSVNPTSSASREERRGPRDSRDKGRGGRSRGGDAYDRDQYERDTFVRSQGGTESYDHDRYERGTIVRHQGGTDPYNRDRYERDTLARYQGGTDPYDRNLSGRGTINRSHARDSYK